MSDFSLNRRLRLSAIACSMLALALLGATSQYLAHFHVQSSAATAAGAAQFEAAGDHAAVGHCSLCVQFDRLPAPPAPSDELAALYFAATPVAAAVPGRTAPGTPHLWPPARAPPFLTC